MNDAELMLHRSEDAAIRVGYDAAHERLYPREYLEGIAHFNAGRYYEAHEIWEEIWLRSAGETKLFYQMLIQAAVGLYHCRRGNARGTWALYERTCDKLQKLPPLFMSLDVAEFARQWQEFFAETGERRTEAVPSIDKPRPLIRLLPCE
jgi:uncharacterized protein